jgi:hypothetical protein
MFIDICPNCGKFRTMNQVVTKGVRAHLQCESCGHLYPFTRWPLIIALGPSGAGKRTLCMEMGRITNEVVCLDSDMPTREQLFTQENYDHYALWLSIAAGVSQSGRPVVLFTHGAPADFENSSRLAYFAPVHYVGICAQGPDIIARLKARPIPEQQNAEYISEMLRINNAVRALPNLIDTSGKTARSSAWELAALTHSLITTGTI